MPWRARTAIFGGFAAIAAGAHIGLYVCATTVADPPGAGSAPPKMTAYMKGPAMVTSRPYYSTVEHS